jgi:hypothetical protein
MPKWLNIERNKILQPQFEYLKFWPFENKPKKHELHVYNSIGNTEVKNLLVHQKAESSIVKFPSWIMRIIIFLPTHLFGDY